MRAKLVLDVIGVRIGVVAHDASEESLLSALAPIVARRDGGEADGWHRTVEVHGAGVEGVLAAAVRAAIDVSPRLLLHTGAVARDGQAVLFPGASGAGKSTMTGACLRRGFGYLSDEMVAVDLQTPSVSGWPRPLMLTPWSSRALGLPSFEGPAKRAVAPALLGAEIIRDAVPVAHVVVMRRGAPASALRPMAAGESLRKILAASFNHYRHGAQAWEAAVRMAGAVQGWHLDVADVDSAADAVAGLPTGGDGADGRRG